jgi:hypothetical protein
MSTFTAAAPSLTRVVALADAPAGRLYAEGRKAGARARGFSARPSLNLRYFGGKTIEHLTFTNVYLGGRSAWSKDDIEKIDRSLAAAMADPHLNNVLAQYFRNGRPTSAFKPSRVLEGPMPPRVYRDTIEGFVAALDEENGLAGFELQSTVFCFLLPRGVVLVDGDSTEGVRRRAERVGDGDENGENLALRERDEAADSRHGLGGYHGSVHTWHGSRRDTLYYAVGVYSEGTNGIVAFDAPWKSICATFYHELCEARTDPDVEDAIRAGDDPRANDYLGWYSPRGGEIGDIPMELVGDDLGILFKEVPLAAGGTAPVQLMWSNAVGGAEGPITRTHAPARAILRSR